MSNCLDRISTSRTHSMQSLINFLSVSNWIPRRSFLAFISCFCDPCSKRHIHWVSWLQPATIQSPHCKPMDFSYASTKLWLIDRTDLIKASPEAAKGPDDEITLLTANPGSLERGITSTLNLDHKHNSIHSHEVVFMKTSNIRQIPSMYHNCWCYFPLFPSVTVTDGKVQKTRSWGYSSVLYCCV